MSKTLSTFSPVGNSGICWSAENGSLRCTAVRLRTGGLCLYSPVPGLLGEASDSLNALGPVEFLLAPNHYHHKGINEYAEQFPEARLVCSDRARPRLEKQTGQTFSSITDLACDLADSSRVLEPEGLKTGEVWIEIDTGSERLWVVTDAFRGPKSPVGIVTDRVELLGTFPKFGIGNRDQYREWVSSQVAQAPPTMIIPCHGSITASPSIGAEALALIE